jgi:hypothetical protein
MEPSMDRYMSYVTLVVALAFMSAGFSLGIVAMHFGPSADPGDWLAFSGSFMGAAFAVLGGIAVVEYQNRRSHTAKHRQILLSFEEALDAALYVADPFTIPDLTSEKMAKGVAHLVETLNALESIRVAISIDSVFLFRAYRIIDVECMPYVRKIEPLVANFGILEYLERHGSREPYDPEGFNLENQGRYIEIARELAGFRVMLVDPLQRAVREIQRAA